MAKAKNDSTKINLERIRPIYNTVLSDVKPPDKERKVIVAKINQIMGRLEEAAPRNVEIVVAGSFARGTNLRGDSDVDVFLLFNRKVLKKDMEVKALSIAKGVIKGHKNESYIIKYAEHPYVRLLLGDIGLNVDVVPAYKIESVEEMGTSVDRTQLHNEFVISHLTRSQKEDVLVLKSFLKSHNIYGADARTEGFSGYLCELLVIHYGSFVKLLEAMTNVRPPVVIKVKKNIEDVERTVLAKRFNRSFVVIDPTDADRNVAANLSEESFSRLVLASRIFLQKPSKESFYGKGHSEERSADKLSKIKKELGIGLYCLYFRVDDAISGEILWQQLRRLRVRLADSLLKRGFEPVLSVQEVEGSDALIGIFVDDVEIPYRISKGPSVLMTKAAESFYKSHSRAAFVTLDNDRLYAVERSDLATPLAVLKDDLSGNDKLPSYLLAKHMKIYRNSIPEKYAKMLYRTYCIKTTI